MKSHSEGNLEAVGGLFGRYAFVAVLLWIGALKLTAYEAEGILQPSLSQSIAVMGYHLVNVRTFAIILGLFRVC